MREAYGAEVLAAMRTLESQIAEVGHHRGSNIVAKWIRKLNARRISRRVDALGFEMSSLERKTPP
jgi:hypothetical protein